MSSFCLVTPLAWVHPRQLTGRITSASAACVFRAAAAIRRPQSSTPVRPQAAGIPTVLITSVRVVPTLQVRYIPGLAAVEPTCLRRMYSEAIVTSTAMKSKHAKHNSSMAIDGKRGDCNANGSTLCLQHNACHTTGQPPPRMLSHWLLSTCCAVSVRIASLEADEASPVTRLFGHGVPGCACCLDCVWPDNRLELGDGPCREVGYRCTLESQQPASCLGLCIWLRVDSTRR